MLRISAALAAALVLVLVPVAAASADEIDPTPTTAPPQVSYPPTEPPQEPQFAASLVTPICDGDVPYIGFDIELVDPDGSISSNQVFLDLEAGSDSTSLLLGTLVNGRLSGRVLWPGASTDPQDWPGWEFVGGRWVVADDEFAWTRDISSATVRVNPERAVPLSYPPSTPDCATSPSNPPSGGGTTTATGALSTTGVSEWTLPVAVGALALLVAGGAALVIRRLAKR